MSAQARFAERIRTLADEATADRERFEPPANPPDEKQALTFLREGVGPAVSLYVEARTGGTMVHFPPDEYHTLEGAMNAWLELYAACYGVTLDAEFTIRKAAELLVDTHDIQDVAQILTGIPERTDTESATR